MSRHYCLCFMCNLNVSHPQLKTPCFIHSFMGCFWPDRFPTTVGACHVSSCKSQDSEMALDWQILGCCPFGSVLLGNLLFNVKLKGKPITDPSPVHVIACRIFHRSPGGFLAGSPAFAPATPERSCEWQKITRNLQRSNV